MDHQRQIGQIQPARRNIGGHADPRPAIAQGLKRVGALVLAEFARQGHRSKAALDQAGMHVAHAVAGGAKHQGGAGLEIAQHVDHRMFALVGSAAHGAIFDIGMGSGGGCDIDAQAVALEIAGQQRNGFWDGGGKQQGAAFRRRGRENEFEIFAKAEIEHFVGLVEHNRAQCRGVEASALQMVAQAARRANDNMAAIGQFALLAPRIHAADAGNDAPAGLRIEPGQFAMHLHREFAGRGHHQSQRGSGALETLVVAQ